jgi:4-oxalmesaconate hydratase
VYHQPGIDLLFKVISVDNIMFASEMIGAVRGKNPDTGFYFDDTKRYVDAVGLSEADAYQVYEGTARKVFPRLDARLKARGH